MVLVVPSCVLSKTVQKTGEKVVVPLVQNFSSEATVRNISGRAVGYRS